MKRFLKGLFGVIFMLIPVSYVVLLTVVFIKRIPIPDGSAFASVVIGFFGVLGYFMFLSVIKNEDMF